MSPRAKTVEARLGDLAETLLASKGRGASAADVADDVLTRFVVEVLEADGRFVVSSSGTIELQANHAARIQVAPPPAGMPAEPLRPLEAYSVPSVRGAR